MKTARIYKIVNTKTVDIYIGSTIQTLKKRFKGHMSNAKHNKPGKLYDCIREYAVENFSIEFNTIKMINLLNYMNQLRKRLKIIILIQKL